jgi:hypothetical protein
MERNCMHLLRPACTVCFTQNFLFGVII